MSKSKNEIRELRGKIMFAISIILPLLILLLYLSPYSAFDIFNYFFERF